MTPSLQFQIDATAAPRGIEGLAIRQPWLPSAYVAGSLGLVALGYRHFFGRR